MSWGKVCNKKCFFALILCLFPFASAFSQGPSANQATVLVTNINLIATIINNGAIFMGWGMFFASIFKFKRYGEMRTMMSMHINIMAPLAMMLASIFLLLFPTFLSTLLLSFWGVVDPLPPGGSGGGYAQYFLPIVMFVRVIGVVSIIRGVLLLSRAGAQQGQPGQIGKAGLHILGGLLSVHIMYTVHLLRTIFGLD